ncbi:MAG: TolC family outer membrane protein [Gammaproteobacteria bacterium]|nr:TolC family outer membrane protein [Gammaproteobacteria bacterium]NNC97533.1 TolC family outer membrane protein [Gammaproteobacteria bacterium]NNM14249.1 TolC family outer membrane protein [Gammaproteobacteria bacterium]
MTNKPILSIALIALTVLGLQNPVLAKDDLASIYQQALQSDPLLREADANRLATNESRAQAFSNLLPQVTAGAGYNQSDSRGTSVSEFFPQGNPNDDSSTSSSWQLQLQQSLFDWDRWINLKRADKTILKSELDFDIARQDLIIRVAQSYFAVLAAQDVLSFEQASKEAIARQLDQTNTRFEVGLVAITDVQEAQAAYDQAIASEIDAKRRLALAKENLREIIGRKAEELAKPKSTFVMGPPSPESENFWVDTSMEKNLNLLSSRMSAKIARDDIDSSKTGHYPTLNMSLSRSGSDSDRDDFINNISSNGARNSTSVGVQLNVPIYSGGRTSSLVRQSVYQHRAAIERVERITRETERATRDAYLNVLSDVSRVRALAQAVKSSQTALQATETGFEVGTRTTVDVLNSRRSLLDAERNYAQSRYDYLLNMLRLNRASGLLDQSHLNEINSLLN